MIKDYKRLDSDSISSRLAREAENDKPESIFHSILVLVSCFALLYGTIEIFNLIDRWAL